MSIHVIIKDNKNKVINARQDLVLECNTDSGHITFQSKCKIGRITIEGTGRVLSIDVRGLKGLGVIYVKSPMVHIIGPENRVFSIINMHAQGRYVYFRNMGSLQEYAEYHGIDMGVEPNAESTEPKISLKTKVFNLFSGERP